jgi:ABC-type bacteriocin/lantibiotic exporter with double-glycine peptidase domain
MRSRDGSPARRYFAPEVVQTSAMDCGPATLKCLLEGFGIPVSYGRLREACQTDVDGTSIDTIEDIAGQLGLEPSKRCYRWTTSCWRKLARCRR